MSVDKCLSLILENFHPASPHILCVPLYPSALFNSSLFSIKHILDFLFYSIPMAPKFSIWRGEEATFQIFLPIYFSNFLLNYFRNFGYQKFFRALHQTCLITYSFLFIIFRLIFQISSNMIARLFYNLSVIPLLEIFVDLFLFSVVFLLVLAQSGFFFAVHV